MTSETDFHALMVADRADRQTFEIFADWLQERDDPRAEGYRVMGRYGLSPYRIVFGTEPRDASYQWYPERRPVYTNWDDRRDPESDLPDAWYEALGGGETNVNDFRFYTDHAAALDDAALAWAKLSPDERAEVLSELERRPR